MLRAIYFCFCLFLAAFVANAQQIITAGSALTETVYVLGAGQNLIAVDRTSIYPNEAQSLPSIGYRTSISAEGIISLKPTLVFAEKDYVKDVVLEQIKGAGVKVIIIERVYTFEGTQKMIREIAETLNRKQEGEKLIASIKADLDEAQKIIKNSTVSPRVLCVFNRDKSSLNIAGSNTFSGILPYTGSIPAITGVDGYKPLNTEALIASQPDYLLMFESGIGALGGTKGVLAIPGVAQTPAGKNNRVIGMDGIMLSNFGPRLGKAVKELTLALHPDYKP
ncbi:MAG: ABC transporter substrate-binding protein [Cyclobacteriaceae bacterium]|nr:ABC transporter substrate-binding protein [Cyclobacteriaceae bacterium]